MKTKKLRNKKTGEIGELCITNDVYEVAVRKCMTSFTYDTLADLNEEWEDYKDPKEYYFLSDTGHVKCEPDNDDELDRESKAIGNYFETKEEAEKVVEKLKAWKRLEDKGFRFKGGDDACISYEFPIERWNSELEKDFELLFGVEE